MENNIVSLSGVDVTRSHKVTQVLAHLRELQRAAETAEVQLKDWVLFESDGRLSLMELDQMLADEDRWIGAAQRSINHIKELLRRDFSGEVRK